MQTPNETHPTNQTAPAPQPATLEPQPTQSSSLNQLLNPQPSLTLQPAAAAQPPTIINATPVSVPAPRRKRRNGHVACLPKFARDMVNRMLWNAVPYKNISAALDELGFQVSERNISNWANGGFLDWRLEQELVLQNRLDQDHLVDHLRREDASELPEVGLQAAATRLTQVFLQKVSRAEDVEANLGTFSQMVDILTRLNREIAVLQKNRDDSRRTLGKAHDPARIKDMDENSAFHHERSYSNPSSDSTLSKPAEPPLLMAAPTSEFLAQLDEEKALEREEERLQNLKAMMRAMNPQKTSPPGPAQASNGNGKQTAR